MQQSKGETGIFRQAALDRLSSPEQLDQLMRVTTPRGWIALAVLGAILLTALVWGVLGSIPTKVTGTGILIKTGGIADVVSRSTGVVTQVHVDVGDLVEKGQVVARLGQPELVEKIKSATANLKELRAQHEQQEAFIAQNTRLQLDGLAKERATVQNTIAMARERLSWLQERIDSQEQLLDKGLITRQTLLSTTEQYNATRNEIDRAQNQLQQIAVQELEIKSRSEQERMSGRFRINEAERNLRALEEQMTLNTEVVSAYTGRVVEVMANPGDLIQASAPVINLEVMNSGDGSASEALAAIIYLPLTEGKKVETGMTVQVSPTTVKREEYGFMLGKIDYVSAFPATYQGMMRVLANDQLVRTLTAGGAPIAIYARLNKDAHTLSGYAWSSGEGPPTTISSGTLCGVSVVIEEKRPIHMVIPYVKRKLGMGSPVVQGR